MVSSAAPPAFGLAMPISAEDFTDALRHFPSGVTIVAVKAGEETHGLTVSAFASISARPPLVAVVIDQQHHAHPIFQRPGAVFAVNILRRGQAALSDRFAWVKDEDRFLDGDWTTAATGAPVLRDAAAWLDCTLYSRSPAGSHTLYVGEVQASGVPEDGEPPLVYWNRAYRRLSLDEE